MNRVRASDTEEASTLSYSSGATVEAQELHSEPGGGSSNGEYMGPRGAFSRPTQILNPEEVGHLPSSALQTPISSGSPRNFCHRTMINMCSACDQVFRGLYRCMHENARANYLAFYSSRLGGITTDPALMVVPMDDHLVHRGHAVFDTATMTQVQQHAPPLRAPNCYCRELLCSVSGVG